MFLVRHVLFVPGATHYRVLGLSPSADPERIGEHYHTLVRFLHPDRTPPDQRQRAARETARLNAAYAVLKDPDSRRRYDLEVAAARPRRRPKRGASKSVPPSESSTPWSWTPTPWLLAGSLGLLLAIGLGAAAITSRPTLRVTVDPNDVQTSKPAYLETAPATRERSVSAATTVANPSARGSENPHQIIERLEAYVRGGDLGAALGLLSEDVRISRGGLAETPGAGPLSQGILSGDSRLVEVSLVAADGGVTSRTGAWHSRPLTSLRSAPPPSIAAGASNWRSRAARTDTGSQSL